MVRTGVSQRKKCTACKEFFGFSPLRLEVQESSMMQRRMTPIRTAVYCDDCYVWEDAGTLRIGKKIRRAG